MLLPFAHQFCKDNADNQTALFEYLDLFLKMIGKDLYVAVTINEVFRNNRALCSQITEVQLRKIINAIESKKLPRYIQVLMARFRISTQLEFSGQRLSSNQALFFFSDIDHAQ